MSLPETIPDLDPRPGDVAAAGDVLEVGGPGGSGRIPATPEGIGAVSPSALLAAIPASGTILRDTRAKLFGVIAGTQQRAVGLKLGDSWAYLFSNYTYHAANMLKGVFGDAGSGYMSFGGEFGAAQPCDQMATQSSTGTWARATVANGAQSIDCTQTTSSEVGARLTVTLNAAATADGANFHFERKVGGAALRYRFNGGGWTSLDTSTGAGAAGYASPALAGVPTSAGWVLDIEILDASTAGLTAYGVEVNNSARGVRLHKGSYPGRTSAHYAATAATWGNAVSALAPDFISLLLGTNDQGNNVAPADFAVNLGVIVDKLRAARPGVDVILVAPPENLAGRAIPMSQYRDAMRGVALAKGCGFVDLGAAWGVSPAEYNDASPRVWMSAGDTIHPTAAGYVKNAEVFCRYLVPPGLRRSDVIYSTLDVTGTLRTTGAAARIQQNPTATNSVARYLGTNGANQADTANLNPGLMVYSGGAVSYGMDLGWAGGQFRTRIFAASSNNSAITFALANNPTTQGSFTEYMQIDAVSARLPLTDLELQTIGKGVILKSPDGTRYRVTVANGGGLVATAI